MWQTLLDAGHEVRGTDVRYRPDLPGRLELADLTEELAAYRLLEGCDAVAHVGNIPSLARSAQPQEVYRINTAMNINVFQAAADMCVNNIAFTSSVQVLAGRRDSDDPDLPSMLPYLPADSDTPARPGNSYALSKQASEEMLKHFALLNEQGCYTAVRLPFLMESDVTRMLRWINRYGRKWGVSKLDEAFSFLTYEDGADLLRLALEKPRPGYRQYFPSAREMRPGWTVADAIARFYPNVPLRQPAEQMTSLVDITKITEDLGWEPAGTSVAVRQLTEAYEAAEASDLSA